MSEVEETVNRQCHSLYEMSCLMIQIEIQIEVEIENIDARCRFR